MSEIKQITIEDNEQFLRQISKDVNLPDPTIKDDIAILDEFCKWDAVLAMAAVQLGIPKRLIYLKNTNLEIIEKHQRDEKTEEEKNYNERKILINPVITSKEGLTEYWETCASCLDNMGLVKRPYKITVEYYDLDGTKHEEEFSGFPSTVISHEIDHLDGILHTDIAEEIIVMQAEERKIFRQTHGYNIISKTGSYDELLEGHKKKLLKSNNQ